MTIMDGFGSRAGAWNFLKVWMVKENARMAQEDWLSIVVNRGAEQRACHETEPISERRA